MSPLQHIARRYRRALHVALGLAAVGMLLWGRLILKEAPRTATADGPTLARGEAVAPEPGPITDGAGLLDVKEGKLGSMVDQGNPRSKSESIVPDDFKWMQAAETAAAELNLQGVTTGKVPVARINGRMIRVGETIDGFTLRSVSGQTAVLERAGTALRLTVRTDGP